MQSLDGLTLGSDKPKLESLNDWVKIVICGMCMGAADIVPGISGGTVAFILGIYEDLLHSIKSVGASAIWLLLTLNFRKLKEKVSWQFLLALLSGISISFITLAQFFDYVLGHETYRVYLYSAFLGLILASVIFCAKQLDKWQLKHFVSLAAGAVVAYLLTGTTLTPSVNEPLYDVKIVASRERFAAKQLQNYDKESGMLLNVPETTLAAMLAKGIVSPDSAAYNHSLQQQGMAGSFVHSRKASGIDWWIVCCGMIAISAMLLPGISGSYLLTILGMYPVVIGALADFIDGVKHAQFESDAFFILLSMLIGILVGAAVFSHVVSWLLQRYHNLTIAALTGFMIGALESVWPFWSYQYVLLPLKPDKGPQLQTLEPLFPDFNSNLFAIAVLFALVGFVLVLTVEWLANRKVKVS